MQKLAIIGCGWLGEKIASEAVKHYQIFCTTTSEEKLDSLANQSFNPHLVKFSDTENQDFDINFLDCDSIIITIPFSQRTELSLLEQRFQNIIKFLGQYKGQLFLCSSTGVYPQCDKILNEDSLDDEALNQSIRPIELLMQNAFPNINILRFGGLMGADRVFSNYYKDKSISEPDQYVNHTHYKDICEVVLELIKLRINSELFNVVAPKHPSKMEVFNCQTNNNCFESKAKKSGKRVSSEKLINSIHYKFIFDDPAKF